MTQWIEHVKKVAKKNKITYKEAMSVAKATYKPKKSNTIKKSSKKMKKIEEETVEPIQKLKKVKHKCSCSTETKPKRKKRTTKPESAY